MIKVFSGEISKEGLKVKPRSLFYKLQKRLFILIILMVSLGPLLTISYYLIDLYRDSWLEMTTKEFVSLTETHRESIELFLQNKLHLLESVLKFYNIKSLTDKKRLSQIFSAINKDQAFEDLGIIDSVGNHLAYVGPYERILRGKNYKEAPWFIETQRRGFYISDVFLGYREKPHFIMAVKERTTGWILRATINTEYFLKVLHLVKLTPYGDAFILNLQGELQTPRKEGLGVIDGKKLAQMVVYQGKRIFLDEKSIYTTATLKNNEWILVLQIHLDFALTEFYKARNRTVALIILGSVIIIISTLGIIHYLIERLKKADTARLEITLRMLEIEKMALMGRLASNIAHEINNPLQIVSEEAGWMEDLLREEERTKIKNYDEYLRSLQKIKNQVKRGKIITQRFLGFTQSKMDEYAETDVNAIIKETYELIKKIIERRNIEVHLNLSSSLPKIKSSPFFLQQVFLNILNNAIDALKEKGKISISTKEEDNNIIVQIEDNGPGIPEEILKRIFDPFVTTKKGPQHLGLGLYIAYTLIKRLGGEIKVQNKREGGALFKITLPVRSYELA